MLYSDGEIRRTLIQIYFLKMELPVVIVLSLVQVYIIYDMADIVVCHMAVTRNCCAPGLNTFMPGDFHDECHLDLWYFWK